MKRTPASLKIALNFTPLVLTKGHLSGGCKATASENMQAQHAVIVQQSRSAIQIDKSLESHIDTLLFEFAKHLVDTRSTRSHDTANEVSHEA
jgi:hypothetical protein